MRPGLTPEQVLQVRLKYDNGHGVSQGKLAAEYHVSRFCIYKAVNYQSHNKIALVTNDAPVPKASDDAVAASARKVAAEIALMQQNAQPRTEIDTDKLIEEAAKPPPKTPYY